MGKHEFTPRSFQYPRIGAMATGVEVVVVTLVLVERELVLVAG